MAYNYSLSSDIIHVMIRPILIVGAILATCQIISDMTKGPDQVSGAIFMVLYCVAKLAIAAGVIYLLLRLFRKVDDGRGRVAAILAVILALSLGVAVREGIGYNRYTKSLPDTGLTAADKARSYFVTHSLHALYKERAGENRRLAHDYLAVKDKEVRRTLVQRRIAVSMFGDLDWLSGYKLRLREEFLRNAEYDIKELVDDGDRKLLTQENHDSY